jgi:hypothetical protein
LACPRAWLADPEAGRPPRVDGSATAGAEQTLELVLSDGFLHCIYHWPEPWQHGYSADGRGVDGLICNWSA